MLSSRLESFCEEVVSHHLIIGGAKFDFAPLMLRLVSIERLSNYVDLFNVGVDSIFFLNGVIVYPMSTLTLFRADFLTPIQLSVRSECY